MYDFSSHNDIQEKLISEKYEVFIAFISHVWQENQFSEKGIGKSTNHV